MNKAFVKEDAETLGQFEIGLALQQDDDFIVDESGENLGPAKNYITRSGFEKLQADLNDLIQNERPPLLEAVETPEAKSRLREVEHRIRYLQSRIEKAEVIDLSQQSADRVLFGATVTVMDENEEERVYQIVGTDEAMARSGRVSWKSPIAKALLQAQVGDFVTVRTPLGEEELEILKIEYKPID